MVEQVESQSFGRGLRSALPIAIGYVPVAVAFGILGKGAGLSLPPVVGMSLLVFAGAAQFMALSLLASGVAGAQIVLAVFLLNLRHLLFSANLSRKLVTLRGALKPLLAFGITDEVFSVASSAERLKPSYLLGLELGAWGAWSGGTLIGYLAGDLLPPTLAAAFATGLYALFASLGVWQIRSGGVRIAAVVLLSAGANAVLRLLLEVPAGWAFLLAMLFAALAGTLLEEVSGE
ncbi:MAG: AzlC family ABC transporter permease [Alkalispirochaetaceae bacterium]